MGGPSIVEVVGRQILEISTGSVILEDTSVLDTGTVEVGTEVGGVNVPCPNEGLNVPLPVIRPLLGSTETLPLLRESDKSERSARISGSFGIELLPVVGPPFMGTGSSGNVKAVKGSLVRHGHLHSDGGVERERKVPRMGLNCGVSCEV